MEAGGMRKRGGGGSAGGVASSMYKDDSAVVDDEEDKPLVGGAPLPAEPQPASRTDEPPPTAGAAQPGTLAKTSFKVGLVIEKLREMDMDDVYRAWSVLQTWLADVPSKLGTRCPPLGSLGRPPELTQEQIELLDRWCEDNVGVPCSADDHGELLQRLWGLSFPNSDVHPELPDPQWKRLGFQGNDPFTDFRSAGRLSLDVLIHFAETYPDKYKEAMKRSMGNGSVETSYPFACAAINVVFMLADIMKLKRPGTGEARSNEPDAALMRATFTRMLETDSKAFLDLSCVCMMFLDAEWVRTNATYMMFPSIMKTTRERASSALRSSATKNTAAAARMLAVDLYAVVGEE